MARITVLARQAFFLLTPFTGRRRRSRRRCRITFVGAAGRERLVQDVKLEAVQVNVRVARRVEAAEAPERGSARLLELESRSPISTEGGTSVTCQSDDSNKTTPSAYLEKSHLFLKNMSP